MPKARLSVALLVPDPVATEVDGLRRALGSGAVGRIPPHVTLVPPVNVRDDRVADALAVLRSAASATRALTLTLGPVDTFAPVNPVVYLAVGGADREMDGLRRLREAVLSDPLARSLTWPFHPHVTVADRAAPERIEAALAALGAYRAEVRLDRVHLLREGPGRVWEPVADAAFEPRAVVGRGGLPVELTVSRHLDPEGAALAVGPGRPFAVTARRDGAVVGTATGVTGAAGSAGGGDVAVLAWLLVRPGDRRTGVGSHLLAAAASTAAARGCTSMVTGPVVGRIGELASFLRRAGWVDDGDRLRRRLG